MDPLSKAQNSGESAKKRSFGRPFQKGKSGNPGGRPKKLHITKMYEKILRNSTNRKEIEASILKVLTSGRMATVLMAREMAERTEGKIAEVVDMNVTGTLTLEQVLEAKKKAGKE